MKRFLSILCIAALLVTTVAGCASKTDSTTPAPAADQQEPAKQKTVITLIQNKVEIQEQLEQAAKDFNASQSDVEVQVLGSAGDNLIPMLQSQFASAPEKAPTIFTCQSGGEFEKFFNYMLPLDSTKASKNIAKGQADDAMKDGKLYGLPMAIEGFGLIYNKDIFKQAGVNAEDIKSMDALVDACAKIAKVSGVKKPIAFAKETYFQFMHPFNWPFAGMSNYKEVIPKVASGELKLNDIPEVKAYAEGLEKLKPYTNLAKDSYDEQLAGFAQGQYAMIHQGNWAQSVLDEHGVKFEMGMIGMPINGNNAISVGNTNFFRVNKNATKEQQDGALAFLDWLFASTAGQTYITDKFKLIPAYTGVNTANMNPLAKEVSSYSDKGNILPWTFGLFPAGVDKDCTSVMEKFYAGQINATQLLDEVNKVWVDAAKK